MNGLLEKTVGIVEAAIIGALVGAGLWFLTDVLDIFADLGDTFLYSVRENMLENSVENAKVALDAGDLTRACLEISIAVSSALDTGNQEAYKKLYDVEKKVCDSAW